MATDLYDLDIEKAVISTLISNKDAYDEVAHLISQDCFYDPEHCETFLCIEKIIKNGGNPDWFSVSRQMNGTKHPIKPNELIIKYGSFSLTINTIASNVAILHDLMVKRKLVVLAEDIKAKVNDFQSDPNDIISYISNSTSTFYRNDEGGISNSTDVLMDLLKNINANAAGKKDITGTPVGLRKFDETTAGLHNGDLVFIAAESSMGKTSIALNISVNAAKNGDPVAWYSMEMSKMQLMARMVAAESGVNSASIMYKPLSETQLLAIDKAMGILSNCKIYFDDRSSSNIDTIESSIRYMVRTLNIKGALIDYIQLLSMKGRRGMTEEQLLGEIARRLKNLAKEMDIWIIALSQLSRDKNNPIPNDNRLRGSGQLKEAADTVMMIYRPEACDPPVYHYPPPFQKVITKGTALIKVTKGRNVGTLDFIVGFDEARTRFYDLDDIPEFDNEQAPPPPVVSDNQKTQINNDGQLPF